MRVPAGDWLPLLPKPVQDVCVKLQRKGFIAYIVGGAVRDLLLGKTPKDFDVVTDAKVEDVEFLFPKVLALGRQFAILVVVLDGEEVEVASFREDGTYADGRHPESVVYSDPKTDALRRDFTMNGLFWDPFAGEIYDYVGGVEDIRSKKIRTIGSASRRFLEDALRMLRALRFYSQLGSFTLDEGIRGGILAEKQLLKKVSRERITDELEKTLLGEKPARAFSEWEKLGIRELLLPKLRWDESVWNSLELFSPGGCGSEENERELALWSLLFSLCEKEELEDCFERLTLGKKAKACIPLLPRLASKLAAWEDLSLAEQKRLVIQPEWRLLGLYAKAKEIEEIWKKAHERRESWRKKGTLNPKPLLTGNDLLANGFPQSPDLKIMLEKIREEQLNENISTLEEALAIARAIKLTS